MLRRISYYSVFVKKVPRSSHVHSAHKIKFLAGVKKQEGEESSDLVDLLFKKRASKIKS